MLRPQECRDKAVECYRMARRSRNSRAREVFKQMARYWRTLSVQAATVEKMSQG